MQLEICLNENLRFGTSGGIKTSFKNTAIAMLKKNITTCAFGLLKKKKCSCICAQVGLRIKLVTNYSWLLIRC